MKKDYRAILLPYATGEMSSSEIARVVGMNVKYVQKLLLRYNLPRLTVGARIGPKNNIWKGGRHLEKGKYWLVWSPNHPHKNHAGYVREHRLVMEKTLGRLLGIEEVVDHTNGDTKDNKPENLRLFANNTEHLRVTLKGKIPKWSPAGFENMRASGRRLQARLRADNPGGLEPDGLPLQ